MISKIKNLFLLLIPISYIIYILWSRVHFRDIFDLNSETVADKYIVYCILLFLSFLRLYFQLKKANIISNAGVQNKYLIRIGIKLVSILEYWNYIWVNLFQYTLKKFFFLNFIILTLLKKLYKWQLFFRPIIVFFDLVPKSILAFLFLLDIVLFKQFHYFYYGLFLLLFPLILDTMKRIVLRFGVDNAQTIVDNVTIIKVDLITREVYAEFKAGFIPPYFVKDIVDYMENHYFPVVSIVDFLISFVNAKTSIYYDYISCIITFCYILGWFFILIMI